MSAPVTNGGSRRAKSEVENKNHISREILLLIETALGLFLFRKSVFWSVVVFLKNGHFILLYFSSLSMVAILGCESHSQAGSARHLFNFSALCVFKFTI